MSSALKIIKSILTNLSGQWERMTVSYLDNFAGLLERPLREFSWNFDADFGWCPFVVPGWQIVELKLNSQVVWNKILDQSFDEVRRSACSASALPPKMESVVEETDQTDSLFGDSRPSRFLVTTNVCDKDISDAFWHKHNRPNFFVCQRVCSPEFITKATEVQEELCKMNDAFRSRLYTPEMFHLTLCTLSLKSLKQVADCFEVLRKACKSVGRLLPQEPLEMVGLNTFDLRVLFVGFVKQQKLSPLVAYLNRALRSSGCRMPSGSAFTPHITLMKLSNKQHRRMRINREIVDKYVNEQFGSVLLRELHLCLMGKARDDQGFYRSYGNITFHSAD
ncbi:A-kinase anchor protein 7 isoform gamma, partial [Fasciola hepatica]